MSHRKESYTFRINLGLNTNVYLVHYPFFDQCRLTLSSYTVNLSGQITSCPPQRFVLTHNYNWVQPLLLDSKPMIHIPFILTKPFNNELSSLCLITWVSNWKVYSHSIFPVQPQELNWLYHINSIVHAEQPTYYMKFSSPLEYSEGPKGKALLISYFLWFRTNYIIKH